MRSIVHTFPTSFNEEFETVYTLLGSDFVTSRTDAFVLSYVKMEKQARKLFTHLVYQMPSFSTKDTKDIIDAISSRRNLFFDNYISGFDNLYNKSFKEIVQPGYYEKFIQHNYKRIKNYRNKILHGQLTGKGLSAEKLEEEIEIMVNWCFRVAESMNQEVCFDGFSRNSFQKNKKNIFHNYRRMIDSIQTLEEFILDCMPRI